MNYPLCQKGMCTNPVFGKGIRCEDHATICLEGDCTNKGLGYGLFCKRHRPI